MNEPVKYRMLDYLFNINDNVYNTFTVAQARARFGVENVSARIHDLRKEGFSIYTNRKNLEDGRKITFYRLGKASKRFTRNFDAGRTRIALKSLYSKAA